MVHGTIVTVTLLMLPTIASANLRTSPFALDQVINSECVVFSWGQASANCFSTGGNWQQVNANEVNSELVRKSTCAALLVQDQQLNDDIIQDLRRLGTKRKFLLINSTNTTEVSHTKSKRFNFDIISLEWQCSGKPRVNWVKNRHIANALGTTNALYDDSNLFQLLLHQPLKLAVDNIRPFNIIHEDGSFSGFGVDMWRIIAGKLSVDVEFVPLPFLEHTKEILVGSIDASCKAQGLTGLDSGIHASPYLSFRENFLIAKPPGVKKRDEAFIDPFNLSVWVGLLVSLTAMWLSLVIVGVFSPWVKTNLFESLTIVCCIMLKASIPEFIAKLDKSLARTMLLYVWLLTASLLSMAYTSNLLASLVKDVQEKPIDTFQDILDNDITVYLNGKTAASINFGKTPVSKVKEVYEKQVLAKPGAVYRMPDREVFPFATKMIASGKGIFDNIEIRQHGVKHIFRRGKGLTFMTTPTFYYQALNNPIMDEADEIIMYMIESGIYKGYLQAKYIFQMEFPERKFYRNEPVKTRGSKLSLVHLKSMFFTFVIPALAIAVFCLEIGAPKHIANKIKQTIVQSGTFLFIRPVSHSGA